MANITRYNPIAIVTRLFKALFPEQKGVVQEVSSLDRRAVYAHLWNYYMNNVYNRTLYGGSLDYINEALGEAAAKDISGLINPVEQVIELYAQNTFAGAFGDEIKVDPQITNTVGETTTVDKRVTSALAQIFKWTNINAEKDRFARYAALFGTVGIRVVAKVGKDYPDDLVENRRVYLQFEHPALIEDFATDSRGNINQMLTTHRVKEGEIDIRDPDNSRDFHIYKMLMTETKFTTLRDDEPYDNIAEKVDGQFANYPNILGFVPYVLAYFRKHDQDYGAWAFVGTEPILDRINALATHLLRQVWRHVNVTWVITTSGEPPKEYVFGGQRVLHIIRKLTENVADTTIEPMVAQLSLGETLEILKYLAGDVLPDRMPELKATMGVFLANQSGETVAQLRKPASDKLLVFRANIEEALIKSLKMALSYGILLGVWEVGTGIGTVEAANTAYQNGWLDFRFNKRPALTLTETERLTNEKLAADIKTEQNSAGFLNEGTQPTPEPASANSAIN